MGIFSSGKDKQIKALSQAVTELQSRNVQDIFKRSIALYPPWDINDIESRFTSTDDIYAIIRLLSTTASLIPLYAYLKTVDKKSFNKLMREEKLKKEINPVQYKSLQKKSLEDLPDTDPVAALLEAPHENQSKFEFFESVYSFLFLHGEAFILKERPEDGVNAGKPIQLHIMFPQHVDLLVSEDMPRRVVGYNYRVNGTMIHKNIPVEDVIHIKYWNPEMTVMGTELRGLSPIKVLKRRLTRLDSNMDVSVGQLQNGGIETIVFDKSTTGEEAVGIIDKRKDNFYRFLKNPQINGAPLFFFRRNGCNTIRFTSFRYGSC